MEVVCLQSEALYLLIEEVVGKLKEKHNIRYQEWITGEEAMQLMHIKSLTTLQRYRDEGRIKYSQPDKKIILYSRTSILEFLEKHAKNPF